MTIDPTNRPMPKGQLRCVRTVVGAQSCEPLRRCNVRMTFIPEGYQTVAGLDRPGGINPRDSIKQVEHPEGCAREVGFLARVGDPWSAFHLLTIILAPLRGAGVFQWIATEGLRVAPTPGYPMSSLRDAIFFRPVRFP